MKLAIVLGALGTIACTPLSAQTTNESGDSIDQLSIDQLMRLATLPPARITEMHCAGLGQWLAANRPNNKKSPSQAAAERLSADVQAAIANDAEISTEAAHELLAAMAVDAGAKVKGKGEAPLSAEADRCASLYTAAASPAPLKLHPLANTSVVSPVLASCYAQYRVAAMLSNGEEAKELAASANEARELALKGKTGSVRAAAEAALETEFHAVKTDPDDDTEAGTMRLIMCQPAMQTAAAKPGR